MTKKIIALIVAAFLLFLVFFIVKDYRDNRIDRVIRDSFTFHDNGYPVAQQDEDSITRIYSAENKTAQQIVDQLTQQVKPNQLGKIEDHRAIMVYPEDLVLIMRDSSKPDLIWIELANKDLVAEVMNISMLERYQVSNIAAKQWNLSKTINGKYEGYIDLSGQFARMVAPSQQVVYESSGFVPQRGGGISAGK
ncbi:DUF4247 domain-containing protein [Paenibacillus sedimenti]|uniref:DUF4247 domain-containing protein n=1 Tax=Paenibacillus sedimenti TaxID=2770274 RepID=A0A926QHU3_9BACL|nr:DUF4247 domain-containing protein [Paenibacillus sedimenti]MBD0378898.1 DUF4247 domain-containing protein [Paenibacillus sedimenti]